MNLDELYIKKFVLSEYVPMTNACTCLEHESHYGKGGGEKRTRDQILQF